MNLSAAQITIAVTVFNRRRYLKEAIASALNQTSPVRVMVVEDCGPDPNMESFVRQEFGSRVEYFRNPRRRGLFGNWNACLEYCRTPWLSILHDDDYLAPGFVHAMVALSGQAPDCGLYFGTTEFVDEAGQVMDTLSPPPLRAPWRRVELADTLRTTPLPFPGHIFRVDYARERGGFRASSQFCGDWEMWSRLIARYGAAQSRATVAYKRANTSLSRGCTQMDLSGRLRPLVFVQQKRVLRMLRAAGDGTTFDRAEFLRLAPMSVDYLMEHAAHLPRRILRYNVGLLLRSTPPSARYVIFQGVTRLLGVPFVKTVSRLRRLLLKTRERPRE